jgi:peptidoglycan/xylan/chitin deacetylase (PgdA/CDA1 family)
MMLARGGPAFAARAVRRGGALVLAYHNVVAKGTPRAGLRSLHLEADRFKRQLDLLQRYLTVVPLADLVRDSDRHQAVAAITFDDAYRGAVTLGLSELRRRGLPVTMFLAPERLGGEQFWWDTLAGEEGLVEPSVERHALGELRGQEAVVREWAKQSGLRLRDMPDMFRSASMDELKAASYPGLTFGSHSWSHPNLSRLRVPDLERELAASHDWLAAHFPSAYLPWLAFPYGLPSEDAREVARARGFVGALRIEGGWTRLPLAEPYAVPRYNVPSHLSADGFKLRISGLRQS